MHQISVPLNRQQLELIDRTIAQGVAASRAELLKMAVRETMARQQPAPAQVRPAEPQR
jgi:Arc/MetJ-type ribon-helix-helix transcriptional regulator